MAPKVLEKLKSHRAVVTRELDQDPTDLGSNSHFSIKLTG